VDWRRQGAADPTTEIPLTLFTELGLDPALCATAAARGYQEATPIQARAIPEILQGHDLLAAAQTGTGKTAAFALPILHRLSETPVSSGPRPVRALILVPTRELAAQVEDNIRLYRGSMPLRSLMLIGGVKIGPQMQHLRNGADIIVATPGRLLDHLQQRSLRLDRVETLVLDEADRMLDMGFIRDIRRIIGMLPPKRQNLLFSATFSPEIRQLAESLLHQPVTVEVTPANATVDSIVQRVIRVDQERKRDLLLHLMDAHQWHQVLIFTRTKHGADRLARQMERDGLQAMAIHGNKSQGARTRALAEFKAGSLRALVATDIAARGIDIQRLPRVVNFELPQVAEDYVHRIGRTGRAGEDGEAISLVSSEERGQLQAVERLLRRRFETEQVPGFEVKGPGPDRAAKPVPPHGRGRAPEHPRHPRRQAGTH